MPAAVVLGRAADHGLGDQPMMSRRYGKMPGMTRCSTDLGRLGQPAVGWCPYVSCQHVLLKPAQPMFEGRQLHTLCRITEAVEVYADSLHAILEQIAVILPNAWQYPHICHARITLHKDCYESKDFHESSRRQAATIRMHGKPVGQVEIVYLAATPESEEGPFLNAERAFLNALAIHLGKLAERYQLKDELARTRSDLHEAKAGLRGLLSQLEAERNEIVCSIRTNVERVLLPQIHSLASQVPSQQKKSLALLERGLAELTDPFTREISQICRTLTPAEIEICNMIRNQMSTKEIARVRHVTPATVFKQRESIRRKLSIAGSDANLTAYLLAIASRHRVL